MNFTCIIYQWRCASSPAAAGSSGRTVQRSGSTRARLHQCYTGIEFDVGDDEPVMENLVGTKVLHWWVQMSNLDRI